MGKVERVYELKEISVDLKCTLTNIVPKNWQPQCVVGVEANLIKPSQVVGNSASLMLKSREAVTFIIDLVKRGILCVLSDVDESDKEIPQSGQRKPTDARASLIQMGSKDTTHVPQGHLSTLLLFAHGIKCTKDGIVYGEASKFCICDGGGRILAIIKEVNELLALGMDPVADHFIVTNDHVVQLNIDVSGDHLKELLEFLLHNRDARRTAQGTNQSVEIAALPLLPSETMNYDHLLWPSWVMDKLYGRSKITGTTLEFLPWSIEGHHTTNSLFRGRGKATNLTTALKHMAKPLRDSTITVRNLPAALDFAFECFYQMCPEAVNDALTYAAVRKRGKDRYAPTHKIHTSLSQKIMVWLTAKVYPLTGADCKKFKDLTNKIIDRHFQENKSKYGDPVNGTNTYKKMYLDRFWETCLYLQGTTRDRFNSPDAVVRILTAQLDDAAKKVISEENNRKVA